jgi:hypothetical protein
VSLACCFPGCSKHCMYGDPHLGQVQPECFHLLSRYPSRTAAMKPCESRFRAGVQSTVMHTTLASACAAPAPSRAAIVTLATDTAFPSRTARCTPYLAPCRITAVCGLRGNVLFNTMAEACNPLALDRSRTGVRRTVKQNKSMFSSRPASMPPRKKSAVLVAQSLVRFLEVSCPL